MTPAEADRQNVEDFANESADLLRRALAEAARRRAAEWARMMGVECKPNDMRASLKPTSLPAALHEIDGIKRTMEQWCNVHGLKKPTVYARIKAGMALKEALSKPVRNRVTGGRSATLADQLRTGVVPTAQDCL